MTGADETISFYDEQASEYAAHKSGLTQQQQLADFVAELPVGARILDLGSGGGHDALSLTLSGFQVTAVDGSAGLAKEAQERTGLEVRVLRFEDLDYIEAFDGVWAAATLHHVASEVLSAVFTKVTMALLPNGLLFASFKEADTDWHDRFGRYFCAMTSDRLRNHANEAELVVDRIERSRGIGYDGSETFWLAMTARRKS
ncbi:MAG: methyltransferase domain-containing protein [Alphaproteobacteria bacterium]|nr:methyltransferase domain-containing protein [Alphaproteobacteria bacterium]